LGGSQHKSSASAGIHSSSVDTARAIRVAAWLSTGAKAEALCLLIHGDASRSLSIAAALALAALSPRPHDPRLATPRRASESGVRPSKEFWLPEPTASVASSSTRSATAPGGEAAEELWCLYGHVKPA